MGRVENDSGLENYNGFKKFRGLFLLEPQLKEQPSKPNVYGLQWKSPLK
jgi:hypothetical protein